MSEWVGITMDHIWKRTEYGWVGGYDGEQWHQTFAICHRGGASWFALSDTEELVRHPITHYLASLPPDPPPKPVSLREAGKTLEAIVWDLEYALIGSRACKRAALHINGIDIERCQRARSDWREAIAREEEREQD